MQPSIGAALLGGLRWFLIKKRVLLIDCTCLWLGCHGLISFDSVRTGYEQGILSIPFKIFNILQSEVLVQNGFPCLLFNLQKGDIQIEGLKTQNAFHWRVHGSRNLPGRNLPARCEVGTRVSEIAQNILCQKTMTWCMSWSSSGTYFAWSHLSCFGSIHWLHQCKTHFPTIKCRILEVFPVFSHDFRTIISNQIAGFFQFSAIFSLGKPMPGQALAPPGSATPQQCGCGRLLSGDGALQVAPRQPPMLGVAGKVGMSNFSSIFF